MELDEMKLAWQAMDRRLTEQHATGLRLLRDNQLDKVRHGLRPLIWGQAFQMALGLAIAVWAGAFEAACWHVAHLLVCGLLLHLYGVMLIAFAARNLVLIRRIDYAAPVLMIQRRLAALRAFRVKVEAPANLVLGSFVWILLLWMGLAWFGYDPWSPTFVRWSLASGLTGLILAMLMVWLMRRRGMARRIEDSSVGRSVLKAEAMLREVARFAQE